MFFAACAASAAVLLVATDCDALSFLAHKKLAKKLKARVLRHPVDVLVPYQELVTGTRSETATETAWFP